MLNSEVKGGIEVLKKWICDTGRKFFEEESIGLIYYGNFFVV